jgi:AraC-like DNA-binding protein
VSAIQLNIYSVALLLGFIQGALYAVLLWIRGYRNERISDTLLGFLLLALCIEVVPYMLGFMGINVLWQELYFFPHNLGLLIGPFFYLYFLSQTTPNFQLRLSQYWHFVPFIFFFLYHIIVFSLGHDFVVQWDERIQSGYHIGFLEQLLTFVSNVSYLVVSYNYYRQFRRWAPSAFSNLETVSFSWFRDLVVLFLAGIMVSWGMEIFDHFASLDYAQDWWDKVIIVIIIYFVSISGYHQQQPKLTAMADDKASKTKLSLAPEDVESIRTTLIVLMERDKLYLQIDLTLGDMARLANTNSSRLSFVLNNVFEKSFNDFVNAYRVNKVVDLLENGRGEQLSLLGVDYECGFSSKSTFNRAFKRQKGVTPKEFLKAKP